MLRLTPVLPVKHHVKLRESALLSRNKRDVVKISSECDAIQTAGDNFLYLCDHRINRPYRLYTVVRPMLDLVDELTNWYICFNRRRLKGENAPEDAVIALNTLFETLFTLCRTSSFTPLLTENIYQVLRSLFPKGNQDLGHGDDLGSVHFLRFPEVRAEYPVIVGQVKHMQTVINLGRTIRERKMISLQTPLQELVVFHTNSEYHEDVKKLQNYVEDELNVHQIIYSKRSSESETWLRGDLTDSCYVDKELPSLNNSPRAPAYEKNTDEDAVILLNCDLRPELESEGFARELMNRIQRLQKKAGTVQTDELDVYYSFFEDSDPEPNQFFEHVLATQAEPEVLCRVLRKVPEPDTLRDSSKPVLAQELQERWGDVGLAETRRSDNPLSSGSHELDVIGQVNTWLP
ncbi:hypothetical protein KEM48_001321 [Puccinia striiformis f. sp. tritici PST-130]|nr:hypothetical protein KEM48_001321 [Puccinia striiformis f. sp. tritici PST-130]